jgi:hypothetical protein
MNLHESAFAESFISKARRERVLELLARTVTNSPANLTIIGGTTAVALLVLTTIHNSRWAVAYLLVFGIAHPQWVPALTSRQILFVLPPSL